MKTVNLKSEYSKRLVALEKNLTAQDKTDAMEEVKISRPTLDKYLSGDTPKIDIAQKLIQFFTDRINERLAELRETIIA